MRRKIFTLVLALLAAPALAAAQPVLTPPAHLPTPRPGPHLPTPHPAPIPPHYYFDCTLSNSSFANMHIWNVHNYGRNTAPAGLHFHAFIGSLHGEWVLPSPLGPDQTQTFGTPATSLDRPPLTNEQCEAYQDVTP